MPIGTGTLTCRAVSASAPSELAWILNLLTQTARYAEPALAELDASLLPGIAGLRGPITERTRQLWQDGQPASTELLLCADQAGCLLDDKPDRLFSWLRSGASVKADAYALITESAQDRSTIRGRLAKLSQDGRARDSFVGVLVDLWRLASPAWARHGRELVAEACTAWNARLQTGVHISELVPPRHPMSRVDEPELEELFTQRSEFALSPLYFCMSGGHVVDFGTYFHVAVPASELLPARRVRDASFVADRLRVLAEPTRVRVLLQAMSAPAGVMEMSRSLRISQPTVSGHLKVLLNAGLVQRHRQGGQTVFVASRRRVERLLEDARATIARWE
ncbi:MAG TPA: metalloregulator ArsR/SmtB family transcription factor [Candidatus Limnocylindrales bacterium]|nr:metalloregulator ArsR/SmtB family transcription factor [Candidatus Limnocylindrales bacterium]